MKSPLTSCVFNFVVSLIFIGLNIGLVITHLMTGQWLWAVVHIILLTFFVCLARHIYRVMLEWEMTVAATLVSLIEDVEELKKGEVVKSEEANLN